MTMTRRRAVREQVPLFIGLSSGTGAGKTLSALKLATGISGRDRPFSVIDTEAGRSRHYAPPPGEKPNFRTTFNFEVIDLEAPFSSLRYLEAINSCKDAPCIVVDQATFEHTGVGGCLELQQSELAAKVARAKQYGDKRPEWELEKAYNQTSWIKPKHDRKRLIEGLIAIRVPVLFCFRAEEKQEMLETRDEQGKKKTVIIAAKDRPLKERWQPICGKEFEPEMLAHFLLTRDRIDSDKDRRGIPIPLKLNEQHNEFVMLDKPLDEAAGKLFAAWASGAKDQPAATKVEESHPHKESASTGLSSSAAALITSDQLAILETRLAENDIPPAKMRKAAGVDSLDQIELKNFDRACKWLEAQVRAKAAA